MSMPNADSKRSRFSLMLCWLWVGVPLAWGVVQTVEKAKALF